MIKKIEKVITETKKIQSNEFYCDVCEKQITLDEKFRCQRCIGDMCREHTEFLYVDTSGDYDSYHDPICTDCYIETDEVRSKLAELVKEENKLREQVYSWKCGKVIQPKRHLKQ